MWFHPTLIRTEALDRIIQCNRNHTELDMVELIRDIMETQHVDKLSFIPQDLIPLLTMNGGAMADTKGRERCLATYPCSQCTDLSCLSM
jgi:hypothetical protein